MFSTRTQISQQWILSYNPPNLSKLEHKGHLNKRSNIPKEVFLKSKDFPSHLRQWETCIIDARLRLGACALEFQAPCVLSQHFAQFPETSICHHLCTPNTAIATCYPQAILHPQPQPRSVPPSSTSAQSTPSSTACTLSPSSTWPRARSHRPQTRHHLPRPGLEHATMDPKNANAIIDLKPAVIDLATVVLPSLLVRPLLIVNAYESLGLDCEWLGFDCDCL
jgi:hypothetical protein